MPSHELGVRLGIRSATGIDLTKVIDLRPLNGSMADSECESQRSTTVNPADGHPEKEQRKETGKSILRYPGGKTRAVSKILPVIELQEANTLYSPFFGGGSIEFAFAARCTETRMVIASEIYQPIATFWQHTLATPELVADAVADDYPLSRSRFRHLQSTLGGMSGLQQAASLYVVNRASFSGATNSGGMSPDHPRFTPSAIDRLRNFRASNVEVHHMDAMDLLISLEDESPEEKVIYADPPYLLQESSLYGNKGDTHRDFDHQGFAGIFGRLAAKGWRIIISYNDCEIIQQLYSDFTIEPINWTYGMNATKKSSEILILSPACIREE